MYRKGFLFICLLLLISFTVGGCSKETKAANTEGTESNVGTTEQPTIATTETAPTTEATTSEEAASPWTLVSESKVETKVNYAGFLNETYGVTVGYAGAVSYTTDGGKSWMPSGISSACRYGLDYFSEDLAITCGNSGKNLYSSDQGSSWYYLGDFPLVNGSFNKFLSVIDEDNMYIGAQASFGFSSDGGSTWQEIPLPEGCDKLTGMFFLSKEIGTLMGADGTLYKTTDACATWTTQSIDLAGNKIMQTTVPTVAINYQDENHGMIIYATKDYQLFCIKTEDGGVTWESIPMPKVSSYAPYLSRDGKYLTFSNLQQQISLYQLEDK